MLISRMIQIKIWSSRYEKIKNSNFLLIIACNVANCDEDLGHCILGRVNSKIKCNQEIRKMWRAEWAQENSCPADSGACISKCDNECDFVFHVYTCIAYHIKRIATSIR